MTYDPHDHYWIVAGDESRVWSSVAGAYVPTDDPTFEAWAKTGGIPTRIASEFELDQVLRQHGRSIGRSFAAAEALEALRRIDAGRVKQALGRSDIRSARAGDAAKLLSLAEELQPLRADRSKPTPVEIEGVERPLSTEERLARLERINVRG